MITMTKKFFVPTETSKDWKRLLARPDRHWRTGFSAQALANCWETANGFPPEVWSVFNHSKIIAFQNLKLLMAFPEYKVYLPPRGHPSQNDLFVLAKDGDGNLLSIVVEGKVAESFGPTLANWNQIESKGKITRYKFLQDLLGLKEIPQSIRYQLLHRSASAIIEAKKFNAKSAVMLIHSFSSAMLWSEDFQAFTKLFGVASEPDKLYFIKDLNGISFYATWVNGNPKFLEK
jgi:hypothetical protein